MPRESWLLGAGWRTESQEEIRKEVIYENKKKKKKRKEKKKTLKTTVKDIVLKYVVRQGTFFFHFVRWSTRTK